MESAVPTLVENAVFLDPQWLSDIFTAVVLLAKENSKAMEAGIINHKQLSQIWQEPRYPPSYTPLCLNVLQKYNIAYPLPSDKGNEECSVVPALLPKERPPVFKELWTSFDEETKVTNSAQNVQLLNREYRFKSLPLGFFGRLIVRTSHLVAKGLVKLVCCWRNGMILSSSQYLRGVSLTYSHLLFLHRSQKGLGTSGQSPAEIQYLSVPAQCEDSLSGQKAEQVHGTGARQH